MKVRKIQAYRGRHIRVHTLRQIYSYNISQFISIENVKLNYEFYFVEILLV